MNKLTIVIIAIIILVIGIGGYFIIKSEKSAFQKINSFEECAKAGNPIMQSYPRQCRTSDGELFVEVISKDIENNSNRKYHSRDVEECLRTQILCIEGMEFFSDETGCGCEEIIIEDL